MLYIVTVRLAKNPEHDPRNKQEDACPVSRDWCLCTDATGEHHSLLVEAPDQHEAANVAKRHGYAHVTRVESLGLPLR